MRIMVIAEAGVNHNGDLALAKEMIDAVGETGADIVKFQTFKAENAVSRFAAKADYQALTTGATESQLDMVKKLELLPEWHIELIECCHRAGVQFLSTPFDLQSIDILQDAGMPFWKIPSGEITNLPYLLKIAQTGKPVILSTGMCTLEEVRTTVEILKSNGAGAITVLHCTTEYPAPYADVNLRAMDTIRRELSVDVGYSDHTLGIEVPIAAVAMGATVIEKHFTLDKTMEGPDHRASLEPDEFRAMVRAIRNIEAAMGDGVKRVSPSEAKNMKIARKSIVANRDIKAGEVFTEENLAAKRPGNGISPMRWHEVLGQRAARDFVEDELIEL